MLKLEHPLRRDAQPDGVSNVQSQEMSTNAVLAWALEETRLSKENKRPLAFEKNNF